MQNEINKSNVISSLLWKLLERSGTQGIQFIVLIVLARLLLPEEFGLIAIVMIFISLASVFIRGGLNVALIQKKDADEFDFSSVFYTSLALAGGLYMILFFLSPFIASFYQESELILILRILSLSLFLGVVSSIQLAYVSRNMIFKKFFLSSLGATITSGSIGITAANIGLGIWALVIQHLTSQFITVLILWFTVEWRPAFVFSFRRLKSLYSFGWKLLVSSLLETLNNNLSIFIVGSIYTPATLGFYNRGRQFPKFIISNINGSIESVLFPTLSKHQGDREKVKEIVKKSIMTSSFVTLPIIMGLIASADSLIRVLLTDKWLPAVPFLRIFCLSFALWPIHTSNLQAITALGRSDIFLKIEITKKIISLSILAITVSLGVYAIAWGMVLSGMVSIFINAYPNSKLLNYGITKQLRDLASSLLLSIVMGGTIYLLNFLSLSAWQILLSQIVVGACLYIGLAKVFKIYIYTYLMRTVKDIIWKRGV